MDNQPVKYKRRHKKLLLPPVTKSSKFGESEVSEDGYEPETAEEQSNAENGLTKQLERSMSQRRKSVNVKFNSGTMRNKLKYNMWLIELSGEHWSY